jgi:hypothetical protein
MQSTLRHNEKYPFRSVVSIRKSVDDFVFSYRSDGEFRIKKQAEANAATIALKCLKGEETKVVPECNTDEMVIIFKKEKNQETTIDPNFWADYQHECLPIYDPSKQCRYLPPSWKRY